MSNKKEIKEIKAQGTLGERLKFARTAAGLTQAQLADGIGVDVVTTSRWERNIYQPDLGSLEKIVRELQKHVPEISSDILLGLS